AIVQGLALQWDIDRFRQNASLGVALGMAHIVAGEHGFAAELATTGHGRKFFYYKRRNWSPPALMSYRRRDQRGEIYGHDVWRSSVPSQTSQLTKSTNTPNTGGVLRPLPRGILAHVGSTTLLQPCGRRGPDFRTWR